MNGLNVEVIVNKRRRNTVLQ